MRGRRPTPTDVLVRDLLDRSNHDENGCISVQRNKLKAGYGLVKRGKSKRLLAHRFIWAAIRGPIPDGMDVLHKCDNPSCVNIDHLYLGTDRENMIDRSMRGRVRNAYGAQKLFADDVIEIRRRFAGGGILIKDLAAQFGVTCQYVGAIIARKYWRHV